jgi:hypothetical protein
MKDFWYRNKRSRGRSNRKLFFETFENRLVLSGAAFGSYVFGIDPGSNGVEVSAAKTVDILIDEEVVGTWGFRAIAYSFKEYDSNQYGIELSIGYLTSGAPSDGGNVFFDVWTEDGTATGSEDYEEFLGTVGIPYSLSNVPNSSMGVGWVHLYDDSDYEGDEVFYIHVAPHNQPENEVVLEVTIFDTEALVPFYAEVSDATEGDYVEVSITNLSNTYSLPLQGWLEDDTAFHYTSGPLEGADYYITGFVPTMTPSLSSMGYVSTIENAIHQPNRSFKVHLFIPNHPEATLSFDAIITDDDALAAHHDGYVTSTNSPLIKHAAAGVLANDNDPTAAVDSVVSGPVHGNVTVLADGSFTYSPYTNFHGIDSFSYQMSDGATYASATVTITVDSLPVATDDSFSVTEDNNLTVAIAGVLANDSDSDGDSLTAVKVADPSHGTVTLNANGSFTYTPNSPLI